MKVHVKANESLNEKLRSTGQSISYDCGGKGRCGKCKIRILSGKVDITEEEFKLLTEIELSNNIRLACCHDKNPSDVDIESLKEESKMMILGVEDHVVNTSYSQKGIGVAVDIGTTTVAVVFVNLETGKIIKEESFENPQRIYGLDVISRITYSNENGNKKLVELIRNAIKKVILTNIPNLEEITKMILCANTTMEYLFLGLDPYELGVVPFNFSNKKIIQVKSRDIFGIDCDFDIFVIPSFSAYVGGDIVAGVYTLNLEKKKNCLLLDLGTNGEIVLSSKGKLYSTSTAAGPAFEGGNMKNGMGSVAGTIDSAKFHHEKWIYTTIANANPIGICGSGYLEIIKEGIVNGFIDETGSLEKEIKINEFEIEQNDIRNFQLAKSAISSGIEVLIETAELSENDIVKIYVAGGFGRYASKESLLYTGVIPMSFKDKIEVVGNTSLKGGIDMLMDKDFIQKLESITCLNTTVELANNAKFTAKFIENIGFDYEENN